jgi:hypothetical protein
MMKCEKCGVLTTAIFCFQCSGEKHKTKWRKKYAATKYNLMKYLSDRNTK